MDAVCRCVDMSVKYVFSWNDIFSFFFPFLYFHFMSFLLTVYFCNVINGNNKLYFETKFEEMTCPLLGKIIIIPLKD